MPDGFKHVMLTAVAVVLGAVLLAGCSGAGGQRSGLVAQAIPVATSTTGIPQGSQVVTIDNFNFVPQTLIVAPGTTVTWINHDDIPHLVVSSDKAFTSPALDTDDHYTFHFTAHGTYGYFCGLHPKMTGTIIVQ